MKNIFFLFSMILSLGCFAGGGSAPVNNDCSSATAFATIPTNGSTVCITNQTTSNATNSNVNPTGSCSSNFGTPDDDIWFKFVATSSSHILAASYDSGSSSDIYWQFFSGSCSGTMTSLLCTDNNAGGTVGGLTIGNTYYVRMYTYYSGDDAQYDICMSSPPPPPTNDDCSGALAFGSVPTNGTTVCLNNQSTSSATSSGVTPSGACSSNSGTPDDDVWFKFVATSTSIELSTTYNSGSSSDIYWQVFSGYCSSTMTSLLCTDNNAGGTLSGLTIGNTYYVRMYTYSSGYNSNYSVCLNTPPPPPTNDECSGATNLSVSSSTTCSGSTAGTVEDALQSSQAVGSSCNGSPDDDVWYKFTATSTSQTVTLSNITGSSSDMYHSVYNGTCSSIGTPLVCSDPNSSNISGLTIGNIYYVRVYTYTSTSGQTTDFDICITTPPPPPANSNCSGMTQFCPANPVTIAAITETTAQSGNNYGCLSTQPNPYWYYITVSQSGDINLDLNAPSDVDFALWGPYNNTSAAQAACGSYPAPIDCSYSTAGLESIDAASANVGKVYVLLVTNYANTSQNISLSFDDPNSSGNCACTALPVETVDFFAKNNGIPNSLSWKTLSERDNDFFLVQRSKDGLIWETLKLIEGQGNSNIEINYSFVDQKPFEISYYRLKQLDFNGEYSFTETKVVDKNYLVSFKLYPQPAHNELTVSGDVTAITKIELVDLVGKKVELSTKKYNKNIVLDVSNFKQGVYVINIYHDQTLFIEKIIIE